jgi:hypothetical protein
MNTGGVVRISYLAVVASIGFALLNPLPVAANPAGAAKSTANNEGRVVATLDAPGYTYMELENSGKRFWIAAPTTRVKVGDRVQFVQSMVMNNFSSSTLNRKFDRIIFVTSATVLK